MLFVQVLKSPSLRFLPPPRQRSAALRLCCSQRWKWFLAFQCNNKCSGAWTDVALRNHSDISQSCPAAILECVESVTSAVGNGETDGKCVASDFRSLVKVFFFVGFQRPKLLQEDEAAGRGRVVLWRWWIKLKHATTVHRCYRSALKFHLVNAVCAVLERWHRKHRKMQRGWVRDKQRRQRAAYLFCMMPLIRRLPIPCISSTFVYLWHPLCFVPSQLHPP